MLATTLDVEFDPDTSWDEKKEIYRISNKIVRTSNVTQSAVGDKREKWTLNRPKPMLPSTVSQGNTPRS